jgi:type VI secretion system protein VasG
MVVTDIRTLIDKLNSICQKSFQASVGVCVSSSNYELTWEHLFMTLLDDADNDIALIFRHFGVDTARVKKALTLEIESFPKGNTARPSFSVSLIALMEKSWSLGSLRYNLNLIRSGVLFAASFDELKRSISQYAAELRHIDEDVLKKDLLTIISKSSEKNDRISPEIGDAQANKSELEKYCKILLPMRKPEKQIPFLDEIVRYSRSLIFSAVAGRTIQFLSVKRVWGKLPLWRDSLSRSPQVMYLHP